MQGRNRDTDIQNKWMNTKGEKGSWDELGDWYCHKYIDIYTLCLKQITNENLMYSIGNST